MASYDLDDLDGDAICPSAVLTVYSTCLSRINNTSCRSRGVWYTRSICYRVHLGTQVPNLSELFFFFFFSHSGRCGYWWRPDKFTGRGTARYTYRYGLPRIFLGSLQECQVKALYTVLYLQQRALYMTAPSDRP